MHVHLNDMIFRITEGMARWSLHYRELLNNTTLLILRHVKTDATLVQEVKVKDRAPKLHYIHPNCFEAGRPMEFVACGSHLLQPNFR